MVGYLGNFGRSTGPLRFIWFVNDRAGILKFAHVLFYADELKLLLPVRGFSDCLKIQANLIDVMVGNALCDAGIHKESFWGI
jgi:hypothetical protein